MPKKKFLKSKMRKDPAAIHPKPAKASFSIPASHRSQDFDHVAELISRGPPTWLSEHLKSWSSTVFLGRAHEQRQPTRAEMKKLLREISGAASLLQRALNEPAILDYLNEGGHTAMDSPFKFQCIFGELRSRADRAFNSPSLTNAKGKTKAGRGPAMPDGSITAQVFCALLVAEAWKFLRGEYPAPRSKEAAKAIDLYWQLAGGQKQTWGNDELASWRLHLTNALKMPAEKERAEIRRHMGEYQRAADLLKSPAPAGTGK